MLVNGEQLGQNCPVTGRLGGGWNMHCPMANQWDQINNVRYNPYPVQYTNRQNFIQDPSLQCFSGVNRMPNPSVPCYPESCYPNPHFEGMIPSLQNQPECIPNQTLPYNGGSCEYGKVIPEHYMDNYVEPQCYQNNITGYSELPPQYYPARRVFRAPNYARAPVIPDLPCQQAQPWEYDMCFNVDGQPCQYTAVVDLEDFMNNEKRKEKSRVAARCRRTKEMEIFSELTAALPAKKEEVEQLDKASVMRLAISYLRVRDVVTLLPKGINDQPALQNPKGLEEVSSELSYMKALDGFVLVLSHQGDIVYCSENIADHLGVNQMEIMGQSVFEFSHPCDHDDIREALRSNGAGKRDLLVRLKCTLTSKGRNVHLKSASYKVVHVTGHMLTPENKEQGNTEDVKADKKSGTLVAVGRPIPHPSNIEIPLDSKTFLSKHSLDMKFTYTDDTLTNNLGYQQDDLIGQSLYDFHHAADSASLVQQFKSLFSKGQCETGQYRFLAKTGGYSWVQTQATVITDKQQKPISIVCVNYIISGIECKDEVFAAHQVQHADLKPPVSLPSPVQLPPLHVPSGAIVATILPEDERPIPVTELIFAPRKKEMNKGFLMFSQDAGSTMLKDEPEDLTHLAPTAGDACIPLEDSPFDMFDEFILGDNYCLLGDDLANGSPVDSLTPDHLLSSPDSNETESSCEQSSLLTDLSIDAFDSGRSDNGIDDGNSPFIPTSDELPMLETAVMWGALPDNVSMARPQPTEVQASPAPALQRLLAAPPTGPPPQDLITNIYSDQGLIPTRSVSSWDTGVKRVMKQEEEPSAKRARRSPSPPRSSSSTPSSSVLMNLLDLPQASQVTYQPRKPVQQFRLDSIPVMSGLVQKKQTLAGNLIRNSISPLSLNIDSPIYSLPSSPNSFSPAQKHLSPYSTPQSLSPAGYSNGILSDPYLTQKMEPSPNYPMAGDFLGSNADLWGDAEMLAAFDDAVKLV